jgi:hypothetical protein
MKYIFVTQLCAAPSAAVHALKNVIIMIITRAAAAEKRESEREREPERLKLSSWAAR